MRATVQGRAVGEDARFRPAVELARRMTGARYVVIVADGEPGLTPVDPARAEALVTLAQALNGPTRCALSTLRGGGNRSGADAVLTWQTGFPFRSEEHTSELQSHSDLVCRLLLEKKKQ